MGLEDGEGMGWGRRERGTWGRSTVFLLLLSSASSSPLSGDSPSGASTLKGVLLRFWDPSFWVKPGPNIGKKAGGGNALKVSLVGDMLGYLGGENFGGLIKSGGGFR